MVEDCATKLLFCLPDNVDPRHVDVYFVAEERLWCYLDFEVLGLGICPCHLSRKVRWWSILVRAVSVQ